MPLPAPAEVPRSSRRSSCQSMSPVRLDTHSPSHAKHHSYSKEVAANISRLLTSRTQEAVRDSGVLHVHGHLTLQSPNSFCSGFQTPKETWVTELKHYKTSGNVRTETGLPKTIFLSHGTLYSKYMLVILRTTSERGRFRVCGDM